MNAAQYQSPERERGREREREGREGERERERREGGRERKREMKPAKRPYKNTWPSDTTFAAAAAFSRGEALHAAQYQSPSGIECSRGCLQALSYKCMRP